MKVLLFATLFLLLVMPVAAAPPAPVAAIDDGDENHWPPPCTNGLPGDADCSCVVDIFDLWVVFSPAHLNQMAGRPWNPRADLNGDGVLDVQDELLIGENIGRTCMHLATQTPPGQWDFYWNITELADGTPWPPTFCTANQCWQMQWNEYGWYEWAPDS